MLTACEEEERKGRGEQREENREHKSAHTLFFSALIEKNKNFAMSNVSFSTFQKVALTFSNKLGGWELANVFSRVTDPFSTELVFNAAADRPAARQPQRQTTVSANDTFAVASICTRLTCRRQSPFQSREKQKKKRPYITETHYQTRNSCLLPLPLDLLAGK